MPATVTLELTEANFEQVIKESDRPVLVDFWAEWCMPCRILGPTVDEVAEAYEGRVTVAKFDIEQGQAIAARLGITGIPALVVFEGGEAVDRLVGVQPRAQITQMLDKYIQAPV